MTCMYLCQAEGCNEQACGSAQYCTWGSWSEFSECSATCGAGQRHRQRSLELSSTAPEEDDAILATGVLDMLGAEGQYLIVSTSFLGPSPNACAQQPSCGEPETYEFIGGC